MSFPNKFGLNMFLTPKEKLNILDNKIITEILLTSYGFTTIGLKHGIRDRRKVSPHGITSVLYNHTI